MRIPQSKKSVLSPEKYIYKYLVLAYFISHFELQLYVEILWKVGVNNISFYNIQVFIEWPYLCT